MNTAEFISKLAQEKYTLKEFKKKIQDVYEKRDLSFDLVSDSTMFKWYNGHQTPKDEWLNILAEVLDVNKAELVEGEENPMLKHNNKLEEKYEDAKTEKDLIDAILFDDKVNLSNSSYILISIGLSFMFYLLSLGIISFILILVAGYFIVKDNAYSNKKEVISDENKIYKFKEIMRYIKSHGTVSSVLIHYLITLFILGIIPTLEIVFYRGFYITCTLYLTVGILLYILSRKK